MFIQIKFRVTIKSIQVKMTFMDLLGSWGLNVNLHRSHIMTPDLGPHPGVVRTDTLSSQRLLRNKLIK